MPEAIWGCLGDGIVDPTRWDSETELIVKDRLKGGDDLVKVSIHADLGTKSSEAFVPDGLTRGRICVKL